MPFDVKTMFCDKLDFATAGTIYTDVLDSGAAKLGDVEPIMLEIWSNKAAAGGGTLGITLQDSEDGTTWNDVLILPNKNAAALAPGMILRISLPDNLKSKLRLKLVTTTGFTAGTTALTAGLKARY